MHCKTQLVSGKTAEGKGQHLVSEGVGDGPSVSVENDVIQLMYWRKRTKERLNLCWGNVRWQFEL